VQVQAQAQARNLPSRGLSSILIRAQTGQTKENDRRDNKIVFIEKDI
jgi:hypothetical protein